MPQLTTLVLKDQSGDDHTFIPQGITNGLTTLVESTGTPIGDRRVSIALARSTTGRVNVTLKFVLPVVQDNTVNGVSRPAVARVAYADLKLSFDGTSSMEDRADLVTMLSNALKGDQSMMRGALVGLEGIY